MLTRGVYARRWGDRGRGDANVKTIRSIPLRVDAATLKKVKLRRI